MPDKPVTIPTPQGIPAPEAFHVGSQPTEPEAVDETAQFFKQVEQAFEKRKAETAVLIAHYNQHGWPTYDSGTYTNLPAAPVETVQNALLVKRDDEPDRSDDIYLAQNNVVDPLSLTDIGSRLAENEQGSDPAHDPARRIREETKTREAQKQAEAEKKEAENKNEGSSQEVPISRAIPESACPKNIPRGLRNNNPGNLRGWQKGQKKDAGNQFVVFDTMEDGLSAMAGNILNYDRAGANTVGSIIKKWAPKNENDTESYIRVVSKQLGVHPEQKLNVKDASTTAALISAIVQHENGCNPFKKETLLEAVYDRFTKWNVPYKQ